VTVQEIERLEKQREERRAAQDLQRMKKEELKNMDAGNKNWEFQAMIKWVFSVATRNTLLSVGISEVHSSFARSRPTTVSRIDAYPCVYVNVH
jgi:hypothetical protein